MFPVGAALLTSLIPPQLVYPINPMRVYHKVLPAALGSEPFSLLFPFTVPKSAAIWALHVHGGGKEGANLRMSEEEKRAWVNKKVAPTSKWCQLQNLGGNKKKQ